MDQDDQQFKLVGSDKKYKCPGGLTPVQAAVMFSENVTMSLSSSNDLIVTDDKLDQVDIDYYILGWMYAMGDDDQLSFKIWHYNLRAGISQTSVYSSQILKERSGMEK